MELKGSQTEKNLWDAFAGESQARNKYSYYASTAKKEGYVQIANILEETAANEKEHAKVHFKHLKGIGNTVENLKAAADGENYEHTEMYPNFAKIAREEGFLDIAESFEKIGEVEKEHEKRFKKLLENIEKGIVFERNEEQSWKCDNCGYVHHGKAAIDLCPACKHAKKFFEIKESNY
jgi:rubrerythrin